MRAAEFAFTDQPGHPRRHVLLLLSLALAGAISPPELDAPVEAPPAETSPTSPSSVDPPAAPIEPPAATPSTEAAPVETAPAETAPAESPPVESPPAETVPVETPRSTEAPGGYWSLAEQHERSREPADGEDELTIGSVLFSLGFLRAGAGVLMAVMADDPDLCPLTEARGCSGLRNYGWAGVAEGGLMIGTGITYLAIGLSRRQRHHRWERGEVLSWRHPGAALKLVDVGPWLLPRSRDGISEARDSGTGPRVDGAGLRVQLRF